MPPAPAAPVYRITPLTPDPRSTWRPSQPIEVDRSQVAVVCQALRRSGVTRIRLQPVPEPVELLDLLAERNLPCLMRRQAA